MSVVAAVRRVLCCLLLLLPVQAAAQPYESVGMRAQGMGGAFVAMADDASAVYWNPAGLATGRFFSFVFDTGRVASDIERQTGTLIAVGTPPLGIAYYRLTSVAAIETVDPTTADPRASLGRLRTSHVGVTLLQTIVDGLHVGGTLKYVHGSAADVEVAGPVGDPLGTAAARPDAGARAFDVDLGLMADFGRARAGLAVRNLLEPGFATPTGPALVLPRQVRAGVAVFASETLALTADADLTRALDLTGPRRALAFGAEQHLWQRRVGVRGGVRLSTVGEARPALTAGASAAIRTGVFADGYVAVGVGDDTPSGGGFGLRVVF